MDQDEMSNLYRGHSIDASYQISDQLALRFQRRRLKCEKLTARRQTPSDGKRDDVFPMIIIHQKQGGSHY
jgi:hypothetical protein